MPYLVLDRFKYVVGDEEDLDKKVSVIMRISEDLPFF